MLLLSASGVGGYNTLAYTGLKYTTALNALVVMSTAPLMIAIATFLMFGERLSRRQTLGIATSFAGVIVILARGDPATLMQLELSVGDLWILAALTTYALYSALLRLKPDIHPLSLLAVTIGWGDILLTPLFVAELWTGARPVITPLTIGLFAYVVTFPSVVAYYFYNRGVELVGANRAGPFYHLIPAFGSVLAILFLGEAPHIYHAAGYALVLAGIVTATRKRGGGTVPNENAADLAAGGDESNTKTMVP
jgi:drug/metabolite transporter (DMT)-like permease